MKTLVLAILAGALAQVALASESASPYAGQETRQIKALSPQEVQGLLSGKGLGMAKAAELNGYPGPAHVLELANELHLSERQRSDTQALFNGMESKAAALGKSLVEAERELDHLFASRTVTPAALTSKLDTIGRLQAQVRRVHLEVHLAQSSILSDEQRAAYSKLRGYSIDEGQSTGIQHRHH